MICIPTVADRLVQRTIVEYLKSNKILPIYNASSFGFIEGLGTKAAITKAIELRAKYDWCLKADIVSFFDSIQRPYLKTRVSQTMGRHSLVPIICRIIDTEIKFYPANREKLRSQGIRPGVGIRQGMPLSPILANLVLSKFDKAIQRRAIEMVRYADDLLLFFPDEKSTIAGHAWIKDILKKIDLSIPEIEEGKKTAYIAPRRPLDFLGRQIVYLGAEEKYVARVSNIQINKIKQQIRNKYAFSKRSATSTLQQTIVDLWKSISAYLGIYKDAHNFIKFEQELRALARSIISQMFIDIFGQHALSNLTSAQKNFLGIGHLSFPEPSNEVEF